jgi:hypothetical protein
MNEHRKGFTCRFLKYSMLCYTELGDVLSVEKAKRSVQRETVLHSILLMILIAMAEKATPARGRLTNLGGIRTFTGCANLALAMALDPDAEYRLAGEAMRRTLRCYRKIWATRPFSAFRMSAMISWRREFPDDIIRCGHGRDERPQL